MDCWCHPAGTSEARYTPWSCPCKKKARRFTHENCSQVLTPPVFPVWPKTSICLLPKGLSRAPGPGNREHRGGVCPENIVNDEEDGQDPGSVCRQGGEKHSPNYTDIIRRLIGEFSEIPPVASKTSGGHSWPEGEGVSLISGPDSLLTVLRAIGAMWLRWRSASCPTGWPEGKWWAGGWSIIGASTVSGEASLPFTMALGDTGHGKQSDSWGC